MIDWTVTFGNILTIIGVATGVTAGYYAQQRAGDARHAGLKESTTAQIAATAGQIGELDKSVTEKFNALTLQITEITKGDVRELKKSLGDLQADFREWTTKTHLKNNELTTKILAFTADFSIRVDRLEQREAERRDGERRIGDRREGDRRDE